MRSTPCRHPRCDEQATLIPDSRIDIPREIVHGDLLHEFECPDGHVTVR